MAQAQINSITARTGFPTWSQGTDFIIEVADELERAGELASGRPWWS